MKFSLTDSAWFLSEPTPNFSPGKPKKMTSLIKVSWVFVKAVDNPNETRAWSCASFICWTKLQLGVHSVWALGCSLVTLSQWHQAWLGKKLVRRSLSSLNTPLPQPSCLNRHCWVLMIPNYTSVWSSTPMLSFKDEDAFKCFNGVWLKRPKS